MKSGIVRAAALAGMVTSFGSGASAQDPSGRAGEDLWRLERGEPSETSSAGARVAVRARRFRAYRLDREAMAARLGEAPEESARVPRERRLALALPRPDGTFVRFAIQESPVMEPGLAAKHPDVRTYSGRGIDDPAATIRLDLTPLGFHASVRGPGGAWYIDPFYHLDQSLYATYFRRDVPRSEYPLVEPEEAAAELAGDAAIAEALGTEPELTVGDQLRTYRLALVTDPAYATYFGGSPNVTPAKVTLVNRVTQIYEDETSIRLALVANNDLLNLDTPALATGADGPCGTAACFTAGQVSSCSSLARIRIVIGQLIGAGNYDIGHLALGGPGGGVANLGVVGQGGKAQGCTGVTTPVGDLFAVDYVAHEMGHQFGGGHTFNGVQSNCSGGNRSASNSVEPGSGSSIMAYAGICATDDLQPHSDPYWSQRSFQQIVTYTSASLGAINEVQTVSLRGFGTDGDSFTIRYNGSDSVPIVRGTNYTAAGIASAIQGIATWPGGTVTVANFGGGGSPTDNGFQVTFNGGPLAGANVSPLSLTNLSGVTGFVGETDKGGPVDNKGSTITPTGNSPPVVTAPATFTIPLRTPFALTGSATDPDGDTLTYLWEQTDRGGTTGTGLTSNAKTDGPLFRQFGTAANVTLAGTLQYYSPGENAVTTSPTRVFPDIVQILANDTNADSGSCGSVDCFSEYLPTASYVGFAGVNASPLSLHFRLTARDGNPGAGGVASADTTLLLAANAGPFRVVNPNTPLTWTGNTSQLVTWAVANTDIAPVSAANVAILLSVDGGLSFPYALAATTPNDGSQTITVPNVSTAQARVMVVAVGNVFFDISNADFTIVAGAPAPLVTDDAAGGGAPALFGGPVSPTVTVSATDADSLGTALNATAPGLPAGLSLAVATTTSGPPGARTWTVAGNVTAPPATYPVTVTVADEAARVGTTTFNIVVSRAPTTTALASSANPANGAQGVTLTATVTATTPAGGVPTGSVIFRNGPATLATVNLDASGQAVLTTASLAVGTHPITAEYSGDANRNASTSSVLNQGIVIPAVSYFTLTPCRVVDTRGGAPVPGPALVGQTTRSLTLAGSCGIPAAAKAVSITLTVTQPTAGGNLRLFPSGTPVPFVASINYSAGQTRGNNAVVPLSVGGAIDAFAAQPGGTTVHLIVDVNGYFE
jgi:hypothetical protein